MWDAVSSMSACARARAQCHLAFLRALMVFDSQLLQRVFSPVNRPFLWWLINSLRNSSHVKPVDLAWKSARSSRGWIINKCKARFLCILCPSLACGGLPWHGTESVTGKYLLLCFWGRASCFDVCCCKIAGLTPISNFQLNSCGICVQMYTRVCPCLILTAFIRRWATEILICLLPTCAAFISELCYFNDCSAMLCKLPADYYVLYFQA